MTIDENDEVIFDPEELDRLSRMIYFIALKYNGWSGLNHKDIEMELWIKAMEVIRYNKNIDYNLIAKCCYNKALDICRKAKNDKTKCFNTGEVDYFDFISNKTEQDNPPVTLKRKKSDSFIKDVSSEAEILYILNLFPKDSKEYKYVLAVIRYLELDKELNIDAQSLTSEELKEFGDSRRELEIALYLGYANDTSNGYRGLKWKVRQKLISCGYLGNGEMKY